MRLGVLTEILGIRAVYVQSQCVYSFVSVYDTISICILHTRARANVRTLRIAFEGEERLSHVVNARRE